MKEKCKKQQQKNTQRQKGSEAIVKGWELSGFVAFKLGFLKLICKASLIFKSNLELALSIFLKQRELYELKHVAVECRYSTSRNHWHHNKSHFQS